ncbi:aminoglycoside phosphotransferase family protein [Nostocaceae cyanobacterium CENA357]|uniref:Aminoglycoside phosphotransferase family protein n=1 Tax=Atlanticothrix silvestris CENA357 TaxID=1725252 RepID=A0A8J7L4P7_9CYAN|nr:aminoglycoside phosphotransferase family protein [Atlanticothrix silvestris]MBH8555026.1 aminoglycoside phosphotransferase family protein [Atlanticothrix silvestris CENA357]
MTFILNYHNVFDYLVEKELCNHSEQFPTKIEPVAAKNFNLLLTFINGRKLLVKQELYNQQGKAAGEFLSEWRIQEFLQRFPNLDNYRSFLPEVLHFDVENSIIVFRYLDDYWDLMDFYTKRKSFSTEIARKIGTILGTIHRDTFNRQEYEEFFSKNSDNLMADQVSHLVRGLERVEPEIFGLVPGDGLKFFALYQRYDSLGQAIAELGNAVTPSCLTHNDLKLSNILLYKDWQDSSNNIVRLIDWERSAWGDPAFDLGTLIGSYVQIWLGSLVISSSLSIEESLRLAITPLELLQPSIGALTQAYLNTFPEIIKHRPNFLQRVVQFTGFAFIQQIQAMIQYQKSFGNMGIAMLQVAKTLLSRPVQSMPTIFGAAAVELTQMSSSAV